MKIKLVRLALLCLVVVGTVSCGTVVRRPVGGMVQQPIPVMVGTGQFPPGHQQFTQNQGQIDYQGGQQVHYQGGQERIDHGVLLQKWDIVDGKPVKSGRPTIQAHPGSTYNGLNVRTNERKIMTDDQFNKLRADINNPNATDPGYDPGKGMETQQPSSPSEENLQPSDFD